MASGFLSIQIGWTEVFVAVLLWYILLRYWENSGKLDKWNASRIFFGMVLMVRTGKGKDTLEMVSKPRKFWRVCMESCHFGSVGVQCSSLHTWNNPGNRISCNLWDTSRSLASIRISRYSRAESDHPSWLGCHRIRCLFSNP